MDLITQLQRSPLQSAGEAASAIAAGWDVSEFKTGSVPELQRIYTHRLNHLRSLAGGHAAQLTKSVEEFVQRLSTATAVEGCVVRGRAEHQFVVFVDPTAAAVIGVMRTVSELDVSADRWEQLWSAR